MARFDANPNFYEQLVTSDELGVVVKNVAEDVATEARRIAKAEAYDEGDYHDGIQADSDREARTVMGRVNANDYKSHWIEAGTSTEPAIAPLRRALENVVGTEQTIPR